MFQAILKAFAALVTAILLASCASAPTPTAAPTRPQATATTAATIAPMLRPTTAPVPISELAPTGKLRIALFLSNSNFITKDPTTGQLTGFWPELARELSSRLGVPYAIVGSDSIIGPIAALKNNDADIGFTEAIGLNDPYASTLDATPPYVDIPITILVPANSPIHSLADLDRPEVRIAVTKDGSADTFLTRDLKQGQIVRAPGPSDQLKSGQANAWAAPLPSQLAFIGSSSDYRILSEHLLVNAQVISLPKGHPAALAYLKAFIEDAKASGLIQRLIDLSGRKGILVSPKVP